MYFVLLCFLCGFRQVGRWHPHPEGGALVLDGIHPDAAAQLLFQRHFRAGQAHAAVNIAGFGIQNFVE